MPIAVPCACGKSLSARGELAGKRVRCPACQAVLTVPKPDSEEAAVEFLLAEGPPPTPTPAAKRNPPAEPDERDSYSASPPPLPKPKPEKRSRPDVPKQKRRSRDEGSGWNFPSVAINPSIISGFLMMAGAVVWFVVGLYLGWIYFYPPILFVAGIGAIIRGFRGEE